MARERILRLPASDGRLHIAIAEDLERKSLRRAPSVEVLRQLRVKRLSTKIVVQRLCPSLLAVPDGVNQKDKSVDTW